MNESSAYLWKNVEGKEFNTEALKNLLLDEYEVDENTAKTDAETIARQWLEAGIVE